MREFSAAKGKNPFFKALCAAGKSAVQNPDDEATVRKLNFSLGVFIKTALSRPHAFWSFFRMNRTLHSGHAELRFFSNIIRHTLFFRLNIFGLLCR